MTRTLSRRSFAELCAALACAALPGRAFASDQTAAALAEAQSGRDAAAARFDEAAARYQQACLDLEDTKAQIESVTREIEAALSQLGQQPAGQAGADGAAELQARQEALDASLSDLYALREQKEAQVEQLAQCREEAASLLSSAEAQVSELSEQYACELAEEQAGDAALGGTSGAGASDAGITYDEVGSDAAPADGASDKVGESRDAAAVEAPAAATTPAATTPGATTDTAALAAAQAQADPEAVHGNSAASLAASGPQTVDAALQAEYDRISAATRAELADLLAAPQDAQAYGGTSVARVIEACAAVASPGLGWCAAWVSSVFEEAGVGRFDGDACDMYADWCTTSARRELRAGMIVGVSTHELSEAGRIYGHVGIYVGAGKVVDNVGPIRISSIDDWIAAYGTVVPVRWGWIGGVVLVSETSFDDVAADAWYAEFTEYVHEQGLMSGYKYRDELTGIFGPEDAVTRAQVATVLARHAQGDEGQGTGKVFSDVPADAWYAGAVEWCQKQGIVTGDMANGKPVGTFRPDASVTREELAAMVFRYASMCGETADTSDLGGFPDAADISDFAIEPLGWCYRCGIITGHSGSGLLKPKDSATRAQLAKILTVLVRDVLA